ncbi:MAG: RdgB/HAM1 family non-canonical purine NTP pyrophosphatase [Candidatus Nanopelagicales bacterium]|nr:RdgB/HAM1 family non-canonical purine NTP pyrophosphatase [Candidatus Nanopelagicales bacterium]
MSRIVLATRNPHKVAEVERILTAAGAPIDLVGIDDLPPAIPDVAETGSTFAENALLKARAVAATAGLPAIADDSGLCVDALNGMPGVLSARWAGSHGDDQANLDLVLDQLADVPAGRRGAQFVCVVALAQPNGDAETFTGSVVGTLTKQRRGKGGFGYDPVFVPEGYSVTTAEMSASEKDAISHRGMALRALAAGMSAG